MGCRNLCMAHQLLQGRQRHPGLHHIPPKGVPKPMGVSVTDLSPHPMMTEQRAKPGRSHRLAALPTFQGDEQSGRIGQRSFQTQIMSQDFEDIRGQRQVALVSFAMGAHLALGELHVFQFQAKTSQDRRPSRSIKLTNTRSRYVRELCQNLTTSSAESGTMTRRSCLRRRPRATAVRGRP
jgi:hypothetical protein